LDIAEDTHVFCVFDGHGGDCVANFCKKYWLNTLKEEATFKDKSDYGLALTNACLKMDEMLWTPKYLQEIYESHGKKE